MRLRKTVGVLFAGILATCFMTAAAPAAHADPTPPPADQWAELFLPFNNPGNHKCADIPSGTSSHSEHLQVFHCHGYASNGGPQRFRLIPVPDGTYRIQNFANNLCMVPDSIPPLVHQDVCDPANVAFRWQIIPTPINPDAFRLRNPAIGGCLGVLNVPVQDHDQLRLRGCDNSTVLTTELQRQLWMFG
ncbi:MAG TPA: ricin-type beta-trefoil lectin domain protein [Mycobacteriales bacterium]|nr:ricin-type beta-trefoil lectin domain protein [Mycobacteriales bacterium]